MSSIFDSILASICISSRTPRKFLAAFAVKIFCLFQLQEDYAQKAANVSKEREV